MALDQLVKELLIEINKISKTDAVVGNVRNAGHTQILPLCKISLGFGTGTAELGGRTNRDGSLKSAGLTGEGAGGGLTVEPRAFVVVGPDGIPHMLVMARGKAAILRRGLEITQRSHPQAPLSASSMGAPSPAGQPPLSSQVNPLGAPSSYGSSTPSGTLSGTIPYRTPLKGDPIKLRSPA